MAEEEKAPVATVRSVVISERLLLGSALLSALLAIALSLSLIFFPYQIDYGEGLILEGATSVRHGHLLYPNPFQFPIVLHVYGPVAYGVTALVLPAGAPSFPAGRLLVLFCSLSLCLLLSWILHTWTGSWWIGASFGLLFLALPAFRFWLYLLRADMIGLLFATLGVALYVWKEKLWPCGTPLFALALFCKFTLVAAPLAIIAHLLLGRRRKQGLMFASLLGVICLLGFIFLQSRSGGWFAFHMFSTHPDRFSLFQFFALGFLVGPSAPVVTGLALWNVVRDFRAPSYSLAAIYFVTSSLTALTAGKLGSTTNHFLEWMVAACLCAGLGYSFLLAKHSAKLLPITLLLGLSILAGFAIQNRPNSQPWPELTDCSKAYEYVRGSQPRVIFSENTGPLILAGKPVPLSDVFVYLQSVKHGNWPNAEIKNRIENRDFGLMVMSTDPRTRNSDIWPQSLLDTIDRTYHPVERFKCRSAAFMLEPNGSGQSGGSNH